MARVPAVSEQHAGPLGRLVYRASRRWYGSMPEPFAVARHHTGLFWASMIAELGWWSARRARSTPTTSGARSPTRTP